MKKLVAIILFLLSPSLIAQTDLSGSIAADLTLDMAGQPYTIINNVTIESGVTVDVEAGVTVQFADGRKLFVNGTLVADNAIFTAENASPVPGIWDYIQVGSTGTSGSLEFTGCTIQYAEQFYINNGTATLTDCELYDFELYGIHLYNVGVVNLSGVSIDGGNDYGIYARQNSVTTAVNTTIEGYDQGIRLDDSSQVHLTDCSVHDCGYPIYYLSSSTLTTAGTCDFTGNTTDAAYVYHGATTNHWIIPELNVPIYFPNSHTVQAAGTMEFSNGNIVKFGNNRQLLIRGALIADADEGENIYFTSIRDDNWGGDTNNDASATSPSTNDWYGIAFEDSSDDGVSVINRCHLRYAGYYNYGGISCYDASPTITNNDISNNHFGVLFQYDSNPVFENNVIGSSEVVPVAMSFEADPTFLNNSFSFSDNEYDAIGILGGTLTADAHLIQRSFTDIENVTYLLLGNIYVPDGLSITIDPGIVIKGYSYQHYLRLGGALIADGTPGENIVFTSVKDDNYGNPPDTNKDGTITAPNVGDWAGFVMESTVDASSIIDNCKIRYPSTGNYLINGQYVGSNAIALMSASPVITNNEISNVYYGISAYQASNPVLSNNTIVNTTYTPFAISASADPVFSGNQHVNAGLNALGLIGGAVSVNGTIIQRDVAGYPNITYVLLSDLTVNDGTEVTVNPGVVIKMNTNTSMHVYGGLTFAGTSGDNIILTSLKDDNFGNPLDTNGDGNGSAPAWGNWRDINFYETTDDSFCTVNYTDMYYGGGGGEGVVNYYSAGTAAQNSIYGCTISDSYYYGVWANGASNPKFDYLTIQNCRLDPVAMSLKSDPTFENITFSANGSQGIRILEGTLSSDATLEKRSFAGITNIAYIIDNLTISPDVTLTLEQGVVIKLFNTSSEIHVQGGLSAIAVPEEKIIFTSLKDDSAGGDTNNDGNSSSTTWGDWRGIYFYDSAMDGVNTLQYCEFRYGGQNYYYSFGGRNNGVIRIADAYVSIQDCIIQQSISNAIGVYGTANPDIHNNEIYTIQYEPIYMSMFADPGFMNNTVLNAGRMAIGIRAENWSQTATIPQRDFAGYSNITYYLYDDITINSGTVITIPAGTVFKTTSSYGEFYINGQLQVDGTELDPVVFTDHQDDEYGNPPDTNQDGGGTQPTNTNGTWFVFNDVSDDNSEIHHAVLKYHDAGVHLQSSSPDFNHVMFANMNRGISLYGVSQPELDYCTFQDLNFAPLRTSLVSYPASTIDNLILGTTFKGIQIVEETLAQDVTLESRSFGGVENIPYIFDNYTVGSGALLTIEPGVVCKFGINRSLTIRKGLSAMGGASFDETVVFTHLYDDFYGGDTNSDGDATSAYTSIWYGLIFQNESLDPLCTLDHCIIRYAGSGSTYGAITTYSASPTITNSTLNRVYNGVVAHDASNPTINFCDIYEVSNMGVLNVDQSFVIDAENNWWGDNTGPTHWENPDGLGTPVSDSVDYIPYIDYGSLNPLMGDVSLNGIIQAFDASLVLQHAVGLITLDPAPQLAADVTGNGEITGLDASYILQYVVDLIDSFPAEELFRDDPGTVILALGTAENQENGQFTIPVHVSQAAQMLAGKYVLSYNPEWLSVAEVRAVGVSQDRMTNSSVDPAAGTITFALAGTEFLPEVGILTEIQFQPVRELSRDRVTSITVAEFQANEKDMTLFSQSTEVTLTAVPTAYALLPNYPNPFNPSTHFAFQLPADDSYVTLRVINLAGQVVATVADGSYAAGTHDLIWNGRNDRGSVLPSGTYLVRMEAERTGETVFSETRKIQMVK